MEILKNNLVRNKTKMYVFPVIYYFDKDVYNKINSILKLAIGIEDQALNEEYDNHLFILVDIKKNADNFKRVYAWLKENAYIIKDYAYDDVRTGTMHILVFNVPPQKPRLVETFMKGQYSKLYNPHEIECFFIDKMNRPNLKTEYVEEKQKAVNVLTRNKNYRKTFVDTINRIYNIDLVEEEYFRDNPKAELELPPVDVQEIFTI